MTLAVGQRPFQIVLCCCGSAPIQTLHMSLLEMSFPKSMFAFMRQWISICSNSIPVRGVKTQQRCGSISIQSSTCNNSGRYLSTHVVQPNIHLNSLIGVVGQCLSTFHISYGGSRSESTQTTQLSLLIDFFPDSICGFPIIWSPFLEVP